jgi:hypothetical protein
MTNQNIPDWNKIQSWRNTEKPMEQDIDPLNTQPGYPCSKDATTQSLAVLIDMAAGA